MLFDIPCNGDNLHEMSNVLWGEKKENITILLSTELVQSGKD